MLTFRSGNHRCRMYPLIGVILVVCNVQSLILPHFVVENVLKCATYLSLEL